MNDTYYQEESVPRSDYAGLMLRGFAFVIDAVLLSIVFFLFRMFTPLLWESELLSSDRFFQLVITFAYFTYFDSEKKGGTFGKQSVSIVVVGEDDLPLPLPKAAVRAVAKMAFNWLPLLWLFPLFSKYRQALHDKIVSSFVMDNSLTARTKRY